MRVLVTGAAGFIGRVFCEALSKVGHEVRAALRSSSSAPGDLTDITLVGNIDANTDWTAALEGVDAVVHIAATPPRHHEENPDYYNQTNAYGTGRLAECAAHAGVRRFVYLSSIKVNGEETVNRSYSPSDEPHPLGAYGRSKYLGETLTRAVASEHGMESVVVRSPLVYGVGVGGNFLRLVRWIDRGWPLPFGSIANVRSLVSVWNLADLLQHVLVHPAAIGRTWMVSDGADVSTPELLRKIGRAMERPVRLLPISPKAIRLFATLAGRHGDVSRLCGSLTVDISETRSRLGWSPAVSVDEALARTVRWYLSESRQ